MHSSGDFAGMSSPIIYDGDEKTVGTDFFESIGNFVFNQTNINIPKYPFYAVGYTLAGWSNFNNGDVLMFDGGSIIANNTNDRIYPGNCLINRPDASNQAHTTAKAGFINSDGCTPIEPILSQREAPLTSTPNNNTHTIPTNAPNKINPDKRRTNLNDKKAVNIIAKTAGPIKTN
jgi:hypothetical protein